MYGVLIVICKFLVCCKQKYNNRSRRTKINVEAAQRNTSEAEMQICFGIAKVVSAERRRHFAERGCMQNGVWHATAEWVDRKCKCMVEATVVKGWLRGFHVCFLPPSRQAFAQQSDWVVLG